MDSAGTLKRARRRAGLTQRELAERSGVAQPAISRIESGRVVPLVDTLDRLLRLCGEQLEAVPLLGERVDRSLIRRLLTLTPSERLDRAVRESNNIAELIRSRR